MNRIYILGNESASNKREDERPEYGWGEFFSSYIENGYVLVNAAVSDLSIKSFVSSGDFSRVLLSSDEGDRVLIQYGKSEIEEMKPWLDFAANLKYVVERLKNKNVYTLLLTPTPKNVFYSEKHIVNYNESFSASIKMISDLTSTPFVDTSLFSMIDLAVMGEEKSEKLYCPSISGGTRLSKEGAEWEARVIAKEIKRKYGDLGFLK